METLMEVLLLHDGELSDIAALLDDLGVSWVEGRSAHTIAGTPGLVIGTPQHLLRWESDGDVRSVSRMAFCDGGGRTLDRKLEAEGIDFILRRPIHPTALRLLILHLIYRGPERRRLRRVSAAVPVKYRTGLWPRSGLLLEFSVGGCQLLTDDRLPADKAIRMTLPSDLGLGRKLAIKGRVVRSELAPDGSRGEFVVAIDFGDLTPDVHQRLAAAVVARARQIRAPAPNMITAPRAVAGVPEPCAIPPGPQPMKLPDNGPSERRNEPRGRYTKAVHGRLGDENVVLMGTNLSPRGMQVDCEPRLAVGTKMKLDLYGHGDIPPLRMEAVVARDDGEQGWFLEFQNLWPGAPALLERLIKTLPLAAPGTDSGMVITEVVERN